MVDGDEDCTTCIGSTTWSSYLNLAKMARDVKKKSKSFTVPQLFRLRCTATEKIDGSNLGVLFRHSPVAGDVADPEAWECILLQGRNAPIYTSASFGTTNDDDDATGTTTGPSKAEIESRMKNACTLPGYGNAGPLGQLPRKLRTFAVRVAAAMGITDQLEVFGEAFRARAIKENNKPGHPPHEVLASRSSFHPFGVKIGATLALVQLNKNLHEIFTAAAAPDIVTAIPDFKAFPADHESFSTLLVAAVDHVVMPPVAYALDEPLIDVVERLSPIMINSTSRYFEGVFIAFETGGGCKYKTGTHDEQAEMATLEDMGLVIPKPPNETETVTIIDEKATIRLAAAWQMVQEVRKTKIKREKVVKATFPDDTARKSQNQRVSKDVTTATEREFGKMATFGHIPRDQRQSIVDTLIPLVLKEVQKNYAESGVELPYPVTLLQQTANKSVKGMVMRVAFEKPTVE